MLPYSQPDEPLPTHQNSFVVAWSEALLAGLPHLLVGLVSALSTTLSVAGIELPVIRLASSGTYIGVLDLVLVGILLLAVVSILALSLRAQRSRRPVARWAASWYGYGLLVVFFALLVPLQGLKTSLFGGRLADAALLVALPLALASYLFWLSWRDPVRALLAALPGAMALWLPVLEFVPSITRAPVTLGAWLLIALAAALITRFGTVVLAIRLAAGANLLVGLLFSATRASFEILPSGNSYQVSPTPLDLGQFTYYFTPALLAISTLLLGPLLVRALWQLGKRDGRPGLWSYRLAVAGLALALVANLSSFWWLSSGRVVPGLETAYAGTRLGFAFTIYFGLLLFLAGALYFGVPALQDRPLRSQVVFLLLLVFLLSLPFMAMMPAAFGFRFVLPGLPVALYDLGPGQMLLAAILGLAWVFLASWLAAQLSRKDAALGPL